MPDPAAGPIVELPPLPASVAAAGAPQWSVSAAVHRACPVCAADAPRAFARRPDGFVVHACSSCGARYLADVPNDEAIAAFYAGYAGFKYEGGAKVSPPSRLQLVRRVLNEPRIRALLETGGVRGRKVCEVGCSTGAFLDALRFLGADVHGVEIDDSARRVLSQKGISCSREIPSDRRFDVVCAFDVLEHLSRPAELVAQIERSLAPDGRFVFAVPNAGEVDRIGPFWIGFRVDLEHLNYFDLRSVTALLARQGLYVEQYWELQQPNVLRPGEATATVMQRVLSRMSRLVSPVADGKFALLAVARPARR